jgi:hypothetical protein
VYPQSLQRQLSDLLRADTVAFESGFAVGWLSPTGGESLVAMCEGTV